jgi:hypothetical protein
MTAQPVHNAQPQQPAVAAVPSAPAPTFVPVDPLAPLPQFEGHVVSASKVKVNGVTDIGIDSLALRVDDVVRLYVEARVTSVQHVVEEKSGDLVRSHVLKPLHAEVAKFDPTDPNDTGIVRA